MGGVRYRGQVLSIDRANRLLTARLWGEVIEGVRYSSHPESRAPWPLCDAWFEQQGAQWRCVRPIGHRRVLFHDDFTRVSSTNGYGDTAWEVVTAGTGVAAAPVTGSGLGVAGLAVGTGPSASTLRKDADALAMPAAPNALHCSFRWAFTGSMNGSDYAEFVLNVNGSTERCMVNTLGVGDANQVFQLVSSMPGTIEFEYAVGAVVATDTWYWIDLVTVDSSFSALCVDGGGPYVAEAAPVAGSAIDLIVRRVNTGAAGTSGGSLLLDCVTVSQVSVGAGALAAIG